MERSAGSAKGLLESTARRLRHKYSLLDRRQRHPTRLVRVRFGRSFALGSAKPHNPRLHRDTEVHGRCLHLDGHVQQTQACADQAGLLVEFAPAGVAQGLAVLNSPTGSTQYVLPS